MAITVFLSGFTGAFGVFRVLTNFRLIIGELESDTASTRWVQETQPVPISLLRFTFWGYFY